MGGRSRTAASAGAVLRKLRRAVKPWYQLARLKNLLGGPYLPRLECHITDHCNLNCAGCSHFSNLAPEVYKNAGEFERELSCLSGKLRIGTLRLLGGEPLLHPELPELLRIARTQFPHSRIEVCTNCTLLEKAGDPFWDAMKDCVLILSPYEGKVWTVSGAGRRKGYSNFRYSQSGRVLGDQNAEGGSGSGEGVLVLL